MASKPEPVSRVDSDWGKPDTRQLTAEPPALVKVRCIVYTRPWTDQKALECTEEAEVPVAVAEIMLRKKQVELVEEEKGK